ncbi:MAG: lysophospholipid acyltransferase family protein [Acidobacteria bacterium]|nr:lysophospholipid acyltransferase family protein [Acidobacteriota bacterium]
MTLVHRIQLGAILLFEGLVRMLPHSWVRAMGSSLGWFAYALSRKHRRIARINLDLVFGEQLTPRQKTQIIQRTYRHFAHALLETLTLYRLNSNNFERTAKSHNQGVFEQALAKGHGAILCTAHYGNWEIMNAVLGLQKVPMSVMARPIDNPLVHVHLERIRGATGNRIIYKHKSVRKILAALAENRVVGIVNDQNVHDRNRIMIPFFGHMAATTPTPAAIAYKTGAPIITGYSVPNGDGTYELRYHPELIEANPNADKLEEIDRISRLLNERLEAQIRDVPHPWFWVHKRFKTGETGPSGIYDRA